jgi:hypothetical protein
MSHYIAVRRCGGYVRKAMNGRLRFIIEAGAVGVLTVMGGTLNQRLRRGAIRSPLEEMLRREDES